MNKKIIVLLVLVEMCFLMAAIAEAIDYTVDVVHVTTSFSSTNSTSYDMKTAGTQTSMEYIEGTNYQTYLGFFQYPFGEYIVITVGEPSKRWLIVMKELGYFNKKIPYLEGYIYQKGEE